MRFRQWWLAAGLSAAIFSRVPKAHAAESLAEADVIRLAKTRDQNALRARAAISVAEAEEVRAGLYPNPSVSWEREQVSGTLPTERDDSIFLTVPIEITGRRPAERALARSGAAAARAQAARTQNEAVKTAVAAFYEALAAERDSKIAADALEVLDEAARVVARRHEEGTTSGYERTRLELEAELARSQLSQAQARARTARSTLAVLLGMQPGPVQLQGDLATVDAIANAPEQTGERRSVVFLRTAEAHASDARASAGWAWVPTLALGGGLRIAEQFETRYGYVAGVSLSLPVFSWGQELRAESSARQRLAGAEVRAAEQETRIQEVRAREQLAFARQEIARFVAATRQRVEILERAVRSGYREGDRSVLELVDAERARTEVERRRLELELTAKKAEIELRAARGEFE